MKVGLQISQFNYPGGTDAIGPTFGSIARAADDGGFASLWVMDHWFQIEMAGPIDDPMLEGYSALSYAAALTSKVKLGTLVTGVTYRHPGLLAKTVTTLDVLSQGRAYLGIGAAWFEREHLALGVPYPPLSERFERLEEALQIVHQMWSGEVKPYSGKHYQLNETLNQPPAISSPHPPILIGGSGEQKTFRLVAKYADACNIFSSPELGHKIDVLKSRCEEAGRDYAEIEKTTILSTTIAADGGGESAADLIETLRGQAALGVDQVILSLRNLSDPARLVSMIGREVVAPALEIAVAGR